MYSSLAKKSRTSWRSVRIDVPGRARVKVREKAAQTGKAKAEEAVGNRDSGDDDRAGRVCLLQEIGCWLDETK